jgi:endonuclease YncB( thermonuclease family)
MKQEIVNSLIKAGGVWSPHAVANCLIKDGITKVIRCKDCKYKPEWIKNGLNEYFCRRSGLWNLTEESFCPYGNRKLKRL